MMDDLLDINTATILVVATGAGADEITQLLHANTYTQVTSIKGTQEALEIYPKLSPELIIYNPSNQSAVEEFIRELSQINEAELPPIFLITPENSPIPSVESKIDDFISEPLNSELFLFRLHHLLLTQLRNKELKDYTSTMLSTIEHRNQALRESQIEIVECLGYAAEFRDSETGTHTIRVGKFTQLLAQSMGMREQEAESLLYSAPMHDVGKIGIPDQILLKPGKLTPDEFEFMKQHTTIGGQILSRSNNKLLIQAGIIALTHHEKWDGSGYPNGLKGTDIDITGRIVAIVDVFDALTMERPYKKAWNVESAVALINEGSGKHFDPSIVAIFNQSLDNIVEIKNTYLDDTSASLLLSQYLPH